MSHIYRYAKELLHKGQLCMLEGDCKNEAVHLLEVDDEVYADIPVCDECMRGIIEPKLKRIKEMVKAITKKFTS